MSPVRAVMSGGRQAVNVVRFCITMPRPSSAARAARKTTRVPARMPARVPTRRAPAEPDLPAVMGDEVFTRAAEVFRLMAAPMRLKIISCLCEGEKNVSELLALLGASQSNVSQHLSTLYLAGVLGRRREGVQVYYRIVNDNVSRLCRSVCVRIAIDEEEGGA